MNSQKRLVDSCNRGFGSLGDETPAPGQRHAIEDRLIDILDHCVTSPPVGLLCVQITAFREFLRQHGAEAGWSREDISLCESNDRFCEAMVLFTAASLKRCAHLQEFCINRLLERGLPFGEIPSGQDYLGV